MKTKIQHLITSSFTLTLASLAMLVNQATAADETLASSESAVGTITVNTPDSYTIGVGSTATRTLTNAIVLDGGNLKGGVMDNVATVSGLSGAGTSTTSVDTNGVTITLEGSGLTDTTANLTLASGVTVTGANQFLVGGGAGGAGGRGNRNDGGGGGGGFVKLTTGNLSDTLTLTAGGGSAGSPAGGPATASGGSSAIGATTAAGGTGASTSTGTPDGQGGNSGQSINGIVAAFTGGSGPGGTGNNGGGGGAGSSENGADDPSGAGGDGTTITTGVVDIATYLGSATFGGGGGGGDGYGGGAGGIGGGGAGSLTGQAGTDVLGGGGGGGGGNSNPGGNGGAGSVAIQYAYNSNVAAGALTLSGGITLDSTSTLDVRSGGQIDVTTNAITGGGGLNIASSDSPGGVVRLSAANTYTGDTTVNAGILSLNQVNALQNSTLDTGTSGSQSVTFDVTGNNTYNIGGLKGADALEIGANTISVGSNDQSTSYTGILSGAGGINKSGTGTLTLSAANSYTGTTTVSGGTLSLATGSSHSGTGAYTVEGGTLKIADGLNLGTHAMTIGLGGVISPGNSPGTAITGNQTWNDGGSYLWEINDSGGSKGGTTGWDWLNIGGDLNLANLSTGGFTIDIDSLNSSDLTGTADGFDYSGLAYGDAYGTTFIIATADTITDFEAGDFILDDSGFVNGKLEWSISESGTGTDLVLSAVFVPEPSSTALLGLGGLALMLRRKRS